MFWRFQAERRAVASALTYRAQVASGDPHMCAMDAVIEEKGFTVVETIMEAYHLRNPGALKWVFHGATSAGKAANVEDSDLLGRLLETIPAAWPSLPAEAKTAEMLKGIGLYLKNHPKCDLRRLAKQLGRESPDEFADRARLLRRSKGASQAGPRWMEQVIADQYNSTPRKRR
jgi:hypothetical protein